MPRTGVYPLASDFGARSTDDLLSTDPYWVVAVIRLGEPMSFNRQKMGSDSQDLTRGASLRVDRPLVITDDCLGISVGMNKSAHTKGLNITLKQTNVNYLVEVLPGDWALAWIVNNRDDFLSLLDRIDKVAVGSSDDSCNKFRDGLKFVGRVEDVYKDTSVDPGVGVKTSNYSIRCMGFKELDTYMYYDYALATSDAQGGNYGWMARFGVSVDALFGGSSAKGVKENNINNIIPILLDLVLGKGPSRLGNISVAPGVSATPQLAAQNEAKGQDSNPPLYSYLVPIAVGNLLGKKVASKGIMSYADIIELWTGVQSFSTKQGQQMHVPDFTPSEDHHRRITSGGELLGTFLPFMPDFANRPLWGVLQQYTNHAINEMYTALKVNPEGLVVPTIVFRQIPFTTDALVLPTDSTDERAEGLAVTGGQFVTPNKSFNVTRFLDLPRWHISPTMVRRAHVGRSNATRTNFVHIYGTSTYLEGGGVAVQYQMLTNKPIMDNVDIFRAGVHTYTTTVDCWVDSSVGKAPGKWMTLVADWMMGSHLTLNGTIECYGIQSPIAEGDNVSFDGVVYHVMNVEHQASIDVGSGRKSWMTTLQVTNGMRDLNSVKPAYNESDLSVGLQPIYPGFNKLDNTRLDPGLSLEQRVSTGGDTTRDPKWDDPETDLDRTNLSSLNSESTTATSKPTDRLDDRSPDDSQVDALARTGVTETPGDLS